jgi:hypothetical protein
MKPFVPLLLLLVAPIACIAQSASQENKPNYKDIVSWILPNADQLGSSIPNAHGTLGSSASTFSNVSIKACTLSYHVQFTVTTPGPRKDVIVTINEDSDFSIGMSPDMKASIRGLGDGPYDVIFNSTDPSIHESGKKTTKYSDNPSAITETLDRNLHGAAWTFGKPNSDHKEVATHMVQALNSLAGLCVKSK